MFPSAEALAAVDPERLAMPRARGRALIGLAAALAHGDLTLDGGADRARARVRLLALPGIGPWTADYVAMRALRDPDAFLPSDLGVRNALRQLGQDSRPLAAERLAEGWRPYRAYALQHLWAQLGAAGPAKRIGTADNRTAANMTSDRRTSDRRTADSATADTANPDNETGRLAA
jgi:AraC family transcriptional regulator of adaptative response / DNA-3-methyladenine glycosylase II